MLWSISLLGAATLALASYVAYRYFQYLDRRTLATGLEARLSLAEEKLNALTLHRLAGQRANYRLPR